MSFNLELKGCSRRIKHIYSPIKASGPQLRSEKFSNMRSSLDNRQSDKTRTQKSEKCKTMFCVFFMLLEKMSDGMHVSLKNAQVELSIGFGVLKKVV